MYIFNGQRSVNGLGMNGTWPRGLRILISLVLVASISTRLQVLCDLQPQKLTKDFRVDFEAAPTEPSFSSTTTTSTTTTAPATECDCPRGLSTEAMLDECRTICHEYNVLLDNGELSNTSDVTTILRSKFVQKRDLADALAKGNGDDKENLDGPNGATTDNSTQPLSDYADTLLNYGRTSDSHSSTNEYFIDHDGGYLGSNGGGASGSGSGAGMNDADNCTDEACMEYNTTCPGEPMYCNLTYNEYVQMLYDYIYPTVPEWILIISHATVFFMGLVSRDLFIAVCTIDGKG